MNDKLARLDREWPLILKIIESYRDRIDPGVMTPPEEFARRQRLVAGALADAGCDCGLVFSDEHYRGDVPYLGGNTNISVEQVAGIMGPNRFHLVAGLEGGYVAEQLSPRAGAVVHKAELLQLADEHYPVAAERIESILETAAEKPLAQIRKIGLLTPRQVIPSALVDIIENLIGKQSLVDAQELYQRIKYEKSEIEMRLIRDACTVADAVMRGMLAVLKPGMLETEVVAWGYFIARQLGCEDMGFKMMCGSGDANRTLIGQALNRPIQAGDWVHLGVGPTRDGLNGCIRRSVIAVDDPSKVTDFQRYWFDFIERAYRVGYDAYVDVATRNLPARLQEQALVDFYTAESEAVSRFIGRPVDLATLKPYTGTHNAGYTECQEFFGAITTDSHAPLGRRIVTMLDVALRGFGNHWNDVVIPGFDYIVVENTLGKFGDRVETLTQLPINVQSLVGHAGTKGIEP